MRAVIGLLVLALCAACTTVSAPPTISDAERCARFSGGYVNVTGMCRSSP